MNANKLFTEFSLKKIWDKLSQHDKAMNSTILIIPSGNWTEQEDGTFKNTVSYSTFKDTDKLTVDLYDDGSLTEAQLNEYEQYIDSFEIINGALVAIANTKPTQTFTVVIKGDFEVNKIEVEVNTINCVNDFESTETNVPASGNLARLLKENIEAVESDIDIQNEKFEEINTQFDNVNIQLQSIIESLERGIAPESLSGSVTFTVGGSSSGTHMIVFETPFASVPTVTVSSSNFRIGASATSITKASFILSYGNSSSATHSSTITWSAVV